MKKRLLILWMWMLGALLTGGAQGMQQPVVSTMSWDEASMTALKERKMVFVAVGVNPGDQMARKLFSEEAVRLFLSRHAVGIGMDMQSEEGKFFESKLLLYEWPAYAFFMPYGDLLAIVPAAEAGADPELLLETGRKALEMAEVKKTNSRSVKFEEDRVEEVLAQAVKEDKPVFVMMTDERCQPCLLAEKNVLNRDRVADFYNRHFLNVRIEAGAFPEWVRKYRPERYPCWLFLNGEGKVIYRSEGGKEVETFMALGETALKKAEGVVFVSGKPEELMQKAAQEGKRVFLDFYVPVRSERKQLQKQVYRDPDVAAYWAEHFVSGGYDLTQQEGLELKEKYGVTLPQLFCFMDAEGNRLHEVGGEISAAELLEEARRAVEGRGVAGLRKFYADGRRDTGFMEEYIGVLARAGWLQEAGKVTMELLKETGAGSVMQERYWELYEAYGSGVESEVFAYVKTHRKELGALFGQDRVERKILAVWEAGAEEFLRQADGKYVFDEAGFREYVKRMKKERVGSWRMIARKTRMEAAGKTGDWKTYTSLAEERWNEEEISDAELYSWGVKINENCRDKSVRFQAARWFAIAAVRIEEKEKLTGKVSLVSYKGFFEKLVDELVR